MSNELKILITVILGITIFWNLSVITWTNTPTNDSKDKQEIACLQGGGTPRSSEIGMYITCKK